MPVTASVAKQSPEALQREAENTFVHAVCFHCGLPNPAGVAVPALKILGNSREFCCHGCHAVAKTIIEAGFENYYAHRTEPAVQQRGDAFDPQNPDYTRIEETLAIYDRDDIKAGFVREQGKQGELEETCLMLEDIHCAACVWLNERHIRQLDGVRSVSIDPLTHRAQVVWQPGKIALSDILRAIRQIGYAAHPYDPAKNAAQLRDRELRSGERLLFAGVLGMLVMNFSLATYFLGASVTGELAGWEVGGRWMSFFICMALLLYPARVFFVSAFAALKRFRVNMDVPISLGLSVAFLGSAYATMRGRGEVYYEAIAMFVFLILLSRRWELKGRLYASKYLARLEKHRLKTAQRETVDGVKTVTVTELKKGDVVVVLPGETVPVDGRLLGEYGAFDESLLTGESLPQQKKAGDRVVSGSVNGAQRVRLGIDSDLPSSTLEAIHQLVLRGAGQRPPQAVLINQVASRFIVALLLVTLGVAGYWYWSGSSQWLAHTISVLIVTCPCALALAIPVAQSMASASLLKNGVLPVHMDRLDTLAKADVAVFDKTGTLTEPQSQVVATAYGAELTAAHKDALLARLHVLASQSEHPLSKALARYVKAGTAAVERLENHPGQGVQAELDGKLYRLGSVDFVTEGMPLSVELKTAQVQQVVAFGPPGKVEALFALSNRLRAGAEGLVQALTAAGIQRCVLLSGDVEASVKWVAGQVGIEDWRAQQRPEDKLRVLKALQASNVEGKPAARVLAVGDGVNDAPTLAAADVSVSVSSASDLAQLNSDFVLLGDDIGRLAWMRAVAQKTRRIVRQNLFWAAGYNLLMVPAAAAGMVSPWMAAVGMSLSSLIVIANALRLRRVGADQRGAVLSPGENTRPLVAGIN